MKPECLILSLTRGPYHSQLWEGISKGKNIPYSSDGIWTVCCWPTIWSANHEAKAAALGSDSSHRLKM